MAASLPPVAVNGTAESKFTRQDTVIECGDRSITVRRAGEQKAIDWLEANGVKARTVLADQTISAVEGRLRCSSVIVDENDRIQFDGVDGFAVEHIDVPLTVAPEAFGL